MLLDEPREQITIIEPEELEGVQLMRATYTTHSFARHCHEGYAFGVIERGRLCFHYLGRDLNAGQGMINLACPGESHNGHGADRDGWTYRMFYLSTDVIEQVVAELEGHKGLPFFRAGVLNDPVIAGCLLQAHQVIENNRHDILAAEELLLDLLCRMILRHAEEKYNSGKIGREKGPVQRAIEILEDDPSGNISLDNLAAHARLSKYHLIRVFKKETGLTPRNYLKQIRIRKGEHLLRKGCDISDIAYATGFADQSHFNRSFKSIIGVSPGAYRNFIQDTMC